MQEIDIDIDVDVGCFEESSRCVCVFVCMVIDMCVHVRASCAARVCICWRGAGLLWS